MKAVNICMVIALCSTAALTYLNSCTPGERQTAKTVLDIADYACITTHAEASTPEAVAMACNIAEDLIPIVTQVLNDFKSKRDAFALAQTERTVSAMHCHK